MAKKTPRPVRTLVVFGLAIAVLYGLAALGGTWKPRLGLDLEGGTRITLSAISEGDAVTETKLKQAANIVDARVNGSGVSEAEVSTQGTRNIIVEIPGENRSDLVNAVKRTAQLRFRLVAGQPQPGTPPKASDQPSPSASPSGKANSKKPGAKNTKQPQVGKATPDSRPAPFVDTPTPQPGDAPTEAPSQAPVDPNQQQPQITQKGAPVDKPLEWSQDPGVEWMQKFAKFTCPTQGSERGPGGRQPRRAADRVRRQGPEVPALHCAHRGDRAEVGVVRHATAGHRVGREPRLRELRAQGVR